MIRAAADGFRHTFDISHHASEIGVQSFAPHGGDDWRAVFGAEDGVVVKREMRRGHGVRVSCAPAGARGHFIGNPVADATG